MKDPAAENPPPGKTMSWTTITEADLKDAKIAALVDAFKTAALGSGQTNPVPGVIANVVARIRAEISGCKKNVLDVNSDKIPADLKSLACRMIVRECQSRLRLALKDDEKEEWRQDVRYLERIAACEVPVAAPDNPETTPTIQNDPGSPRISTPVRRFSQNAQDGL